VGRLLQAFAGDPYWKDRWLHAGAYALGRRLFRKHLLALVFSFALARIPFIADCVARCQKRSKWFGKALRAKSLIIIHPQTIGFTALRKLINERIEPTWIYVVDATFFCARQYNHIPGESGPCLRCLDGDFEHARRHQCGRLGFGPDAVACFSQFLKDHSASGHIRFLAQNEAQRRLLHRRFGVSAKIDVLGLWVRDFESFQSDLALRKQRGNKHREPFDSPQRPEIVFHARFDLGKGAAWALRLAHELPEFDFFFPFDREQASPGSLRMRLCCGGKPTPEWFPSPSSNCHFQSVSWEAGLKERVEGAFLTLLPSLWSAPIEGALVKSILLSERVATVDVDTAFSSEIPEELLLKLPPHPREAAGKIRAAYRAGWIPDPAKLQSWTNAFLRTNSKALSELKKVVSEANFASRKTNDSL
jgi:hypothetical protein